MGNICKRSNKSGPNFRTVVPNHTVPVEGKNPNWAYASNRIKTTKYSILSFIPKNLFEQFHRFANVYFILIVALNWVPQIQAYGKEIAMVPVIFVLLVSACKDAYEDFQRYTSDKKINHKRCRMFSTKEGQFKHTEWKDVHPGDFVHLSCNEQIPADILLLNSSDSQGTCNIETSNLDGDTNLIRRQCVQGIKYRTYTRVSFFVIALDSLYQSVIIHFACYFAYDENVDLWEYGTTMMVILVLDILLHIAIETHCWIWTQWLTLVLSFLVFWLFGIIIDSVFFTWDQPATPYWVMQNTIAKPIHSIVVILTCLVALLPRLVLRTIQRTVFPNVIMEAQMKEKLEKRQAEN